MIHTDKYYWYERWVREQRIKKGPVKLYFRFQRSISYRVGKRKGLGPWKLEPELTRYSLSYRSRRIR